MGNSLLTSTSSSGLIVVMMARPMAMACDVPLVALLAALI
jgi:hypothetical protein